MSSERQEPGTGATWQGSNRVQWDDSYEDASYSASSAPGVSPQTSAALGFSPELERSSEADISFLSRAGSFTEAAQRIGRQFLPALIPLLLASLTFIFIVPLSLHKQAFVHGDQLWPIALVILAVAALQGTILFYTDTNEGLWALAVSGGFALFVVIAAFALGGPAVAIILLLLFIILAIAAIRLYMHKVPDGYVDVTYAFKKPNRALLPGINFLLPWESVSAEHHISTREEVWTCPEQVVQVSRDEEVHLKATISYQLSADDALLVASQYDTWQQNLYNLVDLALQTTVIHLTPDDVLIWPQGSRSFQGLPQQDEVTRLERLNTGLYHQLRDKAANWGVEVNWAQVRDISLVPRAVSSVGRDTTMKAPLRPQSSAAPAAAGRFEVDENATEKIPDPSVPAAPSEQLVVESASTPVTPTKIRSEKQLILAYEQIRAEKITNSVTIRQIAAQFEAIASTPELNKTMSFDAAQAARILYDRADAIERQRGSEMPAEESPVMSRPSGPSPRLPRDENLTAGG